jgi:choline dehydrogenase
MNEKMKSLMKLSRKSPPPIHHRLLRLYLLLLFLPINIAISSPSDFVIVGAGSSGSIVAARLIEKGFTVTLLEAGEGTQNSLGGCSSALNDLATHCPWVPRTNLSIFDVPLGWLEIVTKPFFIDRFEWKLQQTTTNTSLPRVARAIGGCGIHNAMIYMRGTPEDFQEETVWAHYGWNWSTVFPFYKKSENNTNWIDSKWHNNKGPVQISSIPASDKSGASFLFQQAAMDAGAAFNKDFNGQERLGVGPYQFLIRSGIRDSTASAYLGPLLAAQHPLLNLQSESVVSRVLFTKKKRATGVEYIDASGRNRTANATHAVILSAGAIGTPPLLQRSGIGNQTLLNSMGVHNVLVDNPFVGQGLIDGVFIKAQFALPETLSNHDAWNRCSPLDSTIKTKFCQAAAVSYSQHRTGAYSMPGLSTGLFLQSPYARRNRSADVQVTFHPWDYFQRNWSHHSYPFPAPTSKQRIVTLEITNNHANSQGSVKMGSIDPEVPNVIDSPYLKNRSDSNALVWGLRQVRRIMARLNATEVLPGANVTTDQEIVDYAMCGVPWFRSKSKASCDTSNLVVTHLGGTSRIGKVVDGTLQVFGVEGLRVADASIMPTLPSGNTHATTMMIGERTAEMLWEEYGGRE